jgi:FMN-dependent NADH-azoreductase
MEDKNISDTEEIVFQKVTHITISRMDIVTQTKETHKLFSVEKSRRHNLTIYGETISQKKINDVLVHSYPLATFKFSVSTKIQLEHILKAMILELNA